MNVAEKEEAFHFIGKKEETIMKNMKKSIAACLLTILTITCFCATSVFAASTRKCYTISAGNTTVYSDTGLSQKYGTIFGSDEIIVLDVTGNYCKVNYPISGGRTKTGQPDGGPPVPGGQRHAHPAHDPH